MDPNNINPNMPGAVPGAPVMPGAPTTTPAAPVVTPSAPAGVPEMGQAPVYNSEMSNPATMATPGVTSEAAPAMPVASTGMPTFDPDTVNFGATDPLTVPEGPKAPDPVEEELKMPLKAADPVPGSIGSAVSMPAGQTPSVSFNDPADAANAPATNMMKPAKKKMDKKTLRLIGILGAVIIVALVIVLITQMI